MQEQYKKIRQHLLHLDHLVSIGRRTVQFQDLTGIGLEGIAGKTEELAEACQKSDILVKLAKNLLASLKAAAKAQAQ